MDPLLTPGQRDASRRAVQIVTGTLAFATAAGVGAVTSLAAQASTLEQAEKAKVKAAQAQADQKKQHDALVAWAEANPVVVHKQRETRTVVGPAVVRRVSAPGVARVGGTPGRVTASRGGSAGTGRVTSGSTGTSRGTGGGTTTRTVVPPPPPPPPVVTSTGS